MSNEKSAPGYLLYIGDEILPNYMGIIVNHYILSRWFQILFGIFTPTWGNDQF